MTEENSNGLENKVIILGEAGVGKTSLIKISIGQEFDPTYNSSTSVTFNPKEMKYNNKKYMFNLWDTIGQEKFRSLTKIFYKNSKLVIFVYDITNKSSFKSLEYWINSVKDELGNDMYIKAIVGNKSDLFLKEEVKEEEAKIYAKEKGAKFRLCSAKNDPLIFVKFLEELCIDVIELYDDKKEEKTSVKLDEKSSKKNKEKCGC